MIAQRKCGHCRFWQRAADGDDEGECRRVVPQPVQYMNEHADMVTTRLWPVTSGSADWCGEWRDDPVKAHAEWQRALDATRADRQEVPPSLSDTR